MKRRLFGYSVKETDAIFNLLRAENERLNKELMRLRKQQEQFDFDVDAEVRRRLAQGDTTGTLSAASNITFHEQTEDSEQS